MRDVVMFQGSLAHTLLSEEEERPGVQEEPGAQQRFDLVAGVSPVFSLLPGWCADKGGPVPDCQPDSQHTLPGSPAALQETAL